MKGDCIAVFAYQFPHRKTEDFISTLVAAGARNVVVIAAPKKALKHHDTNRYYPAAHNAAPLFSPSQLCSNLGLDYYEVDHDDLDAIKAIQGRHGARIAIIAGARIIKSGVIALFPGGVVNFHPGMLPATSGLDAFYFTIKKLVPAGVTTHFIDHKVDAGSQIYFDELLLSGSESPGAVVENVYQLQRNALLRFISDFDRESIRATPINRPHKNAPLQPHEKIEVLSCFDSWRAYIHGEQILAGLFDGCERGDRERVEEVLGKYPHLVNRTNSKGWSPLIVAVFNQRIEVAELLLARGANPNATGLNGTTALMYAKTRLLNDSSAEYGILRLLVSRGANVMRTDCHGKSVVDYVRAAGDARMTRFFDDILVADHGVH